MRSRLRICYAGAYERGYPRNRIVIDALRAAGAWVEEAHVPVSERRRDKSGVGAMALASLSLWLTLAYARLIPDVLLRLLRCDVLMLGYVGQLDAIVLGPLARLMGRPVVFNPLVTLTDTVVEDRGRFTPGSIPARAIALLDRMSLGIADLILADTAENARYMTERFGVPAEKIVVVPVGAGEDVFYPSDVPPSDRPLDVLFVGKFIPLHGVDTVVRAAALLERRGVAARFELVGTGQTWPAARALADELGVESISWTDWIPFELLGDRLRAADVALGVFDGGTKAARVIPNKVYQSTACGVATVTRRCPPVEAYLRDGVSAVLVPPDDPVSLADAIEQLADADLRREIAVGGREAFLARGSLEAVAQALAPVTALGDSKGRQWRGRD